MQDEDGLANHVVV